MDTIDSLQKELGYYRKLLGVGENNPTVNSYTILVEQLRQRTEFLKEFKIKEKIGNAVKDDPVYARAMDLVDTLPKMISSVNALRMELKIDFDIDADKVKVGATSPQSIGKRN